MIIRRLFLVVAVLLFAYSVFAQFGQSNRLTDAAARLSRDAGDFADLNYRSYTSSFRNSRTDVEAVLLSQQFAAATQIFYRMVVDRRRNQDLRDAFELLQGLGRLVERNNLQRNTWPNIQSAITEVSRELNYDSSSDNQSPLPGRGGRMTWKGRVDDNVRITIRGGRADVETVGGTPYYDAQPNFSAALPSRRLTVSLRVKKGRGQVYLEEQPSRENDFAVVVRIRDPKGGASDYEFELSW